MTHYFNQDNDTLKSNQKMIAFRVNNTPLKFYTDHGVFSKDNFDRGTEVLLKYMEITPNMKSALDLGCGYGVVGVYLNKVYGIDVDMLDVNKRAIELAQKNIELNNVEGNVFYSDGFEVVNRKYDLIVSNPPIRAGKNVYYRFFEDSVKYLNKDGILYVVINKKHGADSAISKLKTIFEVVEVVNRKKGFNVIKCKNSLTI
jgi:16S rRNA (guanine1207-N2)-methyltransferase